MATKWGILSAGKISQDFVCCLRSLPSDEHKVVAVAGRDLGRVEVFCRRHHIPRAYGSYKELAEDPDVEVVYVGNINIYHRAVGQLMLEAGKAVVMEKPMTVTLKGAQELIRIAERKKVFFMKAMWSRFLPSYVKMMQEIAAGTIGDVTYVYASFGVLNAAVDRVIKKNLGGSAVLDIGVYALNAIAMVFGGEKPLKISAIGDLNEDGVDTRCTVSLQYSGGRYAQIVLNIFVNLPNELIVTGTKGTLKLSSPFWCSTQLVTPTKIYDFPLPTTVLPCAFTNGEGMLYEAQEVRRCLKAGLLESPRMTHKDAELLAYMMEEIYSQLGAHYEDAAELPSS